MSRSAVLMAGIPSENPALYHRVRFSVGDPAAWLTLELDGQQRSEFIVRDIEMERARRTVQVDRVSCPADYAPATGLSGDRATATAQAVAECLLRAKVQRVTTDRSLPYIFAWHIAQAGIAVDYSAQLGVIDRRVKDEQEMQWLMEAQRVTEETMRMACETVALATANSQGELLHNGKLLTSQRLRKMISTFLLERDFSNPHDAIVATWPHSADCHDHGSGPLLSGHAVIIDIFPRCQASGYWGDCTRTSVHGQPTDEIVRMHAAVVAAKRAATAAATAGATADAVHNATKQELQLHGYEFKRGSISDTPVMPHGTGHGIGLEVHEPILLDDHGGTLMAGEVLTIEPGLYSRTFGGVRVEDMVAITNGQPRNFNRLPEGLCWK